MTNAKRIAEWRDANHGTTLTADALMDVLGVSALGGVDLNDAILCNADLAGANLICTDLTGANLSYSSLAGANLSMADLYSADLGMTDLSGANLGHANLYRANLTGADLTGADLTGVRLGGANVHDTGLLTLNTPSGLTSAYPVAGKWAVRIGCLGGDLDGLADIIADRAEWPEARGEEREHRRPILAALHALITAHIAYPQAERLRASTTRAKAKELAS